MKTITTKKKVKYQISKRKFMEVEVENEKEELSVIILNRMFYSQTDKDDRFNEKTISYEWLEENGVLYVALNDIIVYQNYELDLNWNNIFIRWDKIVSSDSVSDMVCAIKLYINEKCVDFGELEFGENITKMIMSVGKPYLNTNYYPACNGFVEKAVGCTTSTSISTLNSLFNNYGTGVYNEFNEFGLKTRKQINTSSSNLIIHTYTYNDSSDGRVLGKLSNETVSLSSILTTYYTYNTDNTISKQRVYNSATGTYKDHTFTYDTKKQLTQYSNGTNTYVYTYDSNGNITQISKNNSVIHTATYTNGILLNTVNGYTISYDSNGYLTAKKSGNVDIERYT